MKNSRILGVTSAFVGICLWLSGGLAQATTILQGTTSAATGFLNLDIGGTIYNVTFNGNLTYSDVFTSTTPTFFGDLAGATSAVNALSAALNGSGVTGISNLTPDPAGRLFLAIPYDAFVLSGDPRYDSKSALFSSSASTWSVTDLGGQQDVASQNVSIVTFTAVPVPAAIWLFGAGLLGLIGVARKKAV